jgi:hypothetical protein
MCEARMSSREGAGATRSDRDGAARRTHSGARSVLTVERHHGRSGRSSRRGTADIYQQGRRGSEEETIAYCRIGERSSHTWFVLRLSAGAGRREELRRFVDRVRFDGRVAHRAGRVDCPGVSPGVENPLVPARLTTWRLSIHSPYKEVQGDTPCGGFAHQFSRRASDSHLLARWQGRRARAGARWEWEAV